MENNRYVNCPVAKYHDFKVMSDPYGLTKTFSKEQKEYCRACKKMVSYKFASDGKMVEEHQYWLDHIRFFAQPSMGEVYFEINPGMRAKFSLEERENKAHEDKQAELSDKFRFALKRALDDRDDGIKKKK